MYKNKELNFNEGIQYSNVVNSSIDNSIASTNENVNTTKYSMQKSENNASSANSSNIKYSVAGEIGMKNAIQNDYSNRVIEQSYNQALQLKDRGVDNESIRQNTNWFQDKNGDWKFEFSDKDMSNIAPESSKANPQHADLKKRKILDKVKNSVYNYFDKKGGNSYEVSDEKYQGSKRKNNSEVGKNVLQENGEGLRKKWDRLGDNRRGRLETEKGSNKKSSLDNENIDTYLEKRISVLELCYSR